MSTEIVHPSDNDDLGLMTPDQVRAELQRCLALTVASFARAAACYRLLHEWGEDVSEIEDESLFPLLKLVANGQTLPELVCRFAGKRMLLKAVTTLPLPAQKDIADGGKVPLVVRDSTGAFLKREVDPADLMSTQIRQVFDHGRIRDEDEQVVRLERDDPAYDQTALVKVGKIMVDRKRDGMIVNKVFFSRAEIEAAFAELEPAQSGF